MARVVNHHPVDHHAVDGVTQAKLLTARDDWLVSEHAEQLDSATFGLVEGPFRTWTRTVERVDDEWVETIDFVLALPLLRFVLTPLIRWVLKRPQRSDAPFWAPPQRFDARGSRSFALLVFAVLTAAYLGTLLSQTITFVADEFGASNTVQGWVTGMTRAGALLSLVLVRQADRIGRRRMLLATGAASAIFAVLGAISPSIWFFGITQTLSRGFATAFALLIGIFAAEESPAGSRAWITSVLALFAGLGSGFVLWLLPIAGTGTRGWRVLFFAAAAVLPVLWLLSRQLNESRRFDTLRDRALPVAPITTTMRRRFAMLAAVAMTLSMFAAPSSNFQNDYLRETRGFSATRISLFSAITSTPVGLGVAIAGPQADRRGRRIVGIIGIIGGVGFAVIRYGFGGPVMWIAATASTIVGAATIPALGVYGPELFPTSRRGFANGLLTCFGVIGSVVGLVFVGYFSDRWGFGTTFALLALMPLVAALIVTHYPETARKALEELNPEDSEPGAS